MLELMIKMDKRLVDMDKRLEKIEERLVVPEFDNDCVNKDYLLFSPNFRKVQIDETTTSKKWFTIPLKRHVSRSESIIKY